MTLISNKEYLTIMNDLINSLDILARDTYKVFTQLDYIGGHNKEAKSLEKLADKLYVTRENLIESVNNDVK